MRFSDWSSDVCSSYLDLHDGQGDRGVAAHGADPGAQQDPRRAALWRVQELLSQQRGRIFRQLLRLLPARGLCAAIGYVHREGKLGERGDRPDARSEEHTSELQSLMRISYAVFCLKKKKVSKTTITKKHYTI